MTSAVTLRRPGVHKAWQTKGVEPRQRWVPGLRSRHGGAGRGQACRAVQLALRSSRARGRPARWLSSPGRLGHRLPAHLDRPRRWARRSRCAPTSSSTAPPSGGLGVGVVRPGCSSRARGRSAARSLPGPAEAACSMGLARLEACPWAGDQFVVLGAVHQQHLHLALALPSRQSVGATPRLPGLHGVDARRARPVGLAHVAAHLSATPSSAQGPFDLRDAVRRGRPPRGTVRPPRPISSAGASTPNFDLDLRGKDTSAPDARRSSSPTQRPGR